LNTVDLGNNPINDASPLGWTARCKALLPKQLRPAGRIVHLRPDEPVQFGFERQHHPQHSRHVGSGLEPGLAANQLQWPVDLLLPPVVPDQSFTASASTMTALPDIAFHRRHDASWNRSMSAAIGWMTAIETTSANISPLTARRKCTGCPSPLTRSPTFPSWWPLRNLSTLYLSSNHFGNLNFITNLPNLNTLAINYSTVTNLDRLTNHTFLGYLDVGYIATTNLSYVRELINLGTLWAGGNHTGTAAFVTNLINLQTLGSIQTESRTSLH